MRQVPPKWQAEYQQAHRRAWSGHDVAGSTESPLWRLRAQRRSAAEGSMPGFLSTATRVERRSLNPSLRDVVRATIGASADLIRSLGGSSRQHRPIRDREKDHHLTKDREFHFHLPASTFAFVQGQANRHFRQLKGRCRAISWHGAPVAQVSPHSAPIAPLADFA